MYMCSARVCVYAYTQRTYRICMYTQMYVCIYRYTYIYVYIYLHPIPTHIHIHVAPSAIKSQIHRAVGREFLEVAPSPRRGPGKIGPP